MLTQKYWFTDRKGKENHWIRQGSSLPLARSSAKTLLCDSLLETFSVFVNTIITRTGLMLHLAAPRPPVFSHISGKCVWLILHTDLRLNITASGSVARAGLRWEVGTAVGHWLPRLRACGILLFAPPIKDPYPASAVCLHLFFVVFFLCLKLQNLHSHTVSQFSLFLKMHSLSNPAIIYKNIGKK